MAAVTEARIVTDILSIIRSILGHKKTCDISCFYSLAKGLQLARGGSIPGRAANWENANLKRSALGAARLRMGGRAE